MKKRTYINKRKWDLNRIRACIFTLVIALMVILPFGRVQEVQATQNEKETVRIGYLGYEGFLTQTIDGNYSGYGV